MNKLLLLYGCLCMGGAPMVEEQESTFPIPSNGIGIPTIGPEGVGGVLSYGHNTSNELDLNEIDFIGEEAEMDLGFKTTDYLPEGFNPYEYYFDLDSIEYVEEDGWEVALGFDTHDHLPVNFDPYAANFDVNSINYMEEEKIVLGFDTADYLPLGFNKYKAYFDLASVEYVDMAEMEWEFGFNTKPYLPVGFDPYANPLAISAINYVKGDEIDLGFDPHLYIPIGFDPYAGSK